MNKLIIYGSQYGTTRTYAERLSQMTGVSFTDYKLAKDISKYDIIVYFGALYAGGVKGLKEIVKNIKESTKLIIVTVGLADVKDETNIHNIRNSLKKQLPREIFGKAEIFHLRGGIDYSRLSFTHKTMMTLLYNKAKNMPEEKKNAEVKAMIDTFNKKVDFIDVESLKPIYNMIL